MAAHGDATVTIDTNEMTFIDQNGIPSTVVNGQTFVFELAAAGSAEKYKVKSGVLTLTDGRKIRLDCGLSEFQVAADATQAKNAGSLWIEEPNGHRAEWKIKTVTINNIDQPTAITEMTLERVGDKTQTITLSSITVSQ